MSLYKRIFLLLGPHWKRLVLASGSASFHAVLSGLLVWMVGPLLMTLFQVENLPGLSDVAPPTGGTEAPQAGADIVNTASTWIEQLKASLKGWVSGLVSSETRQDTLVRFCWLILIVVVAKNFFSYLQGFVIAWVQQSIVPRVTNDVLVLHDSIDIGFNHLVTDIIMSVLFVSFLVILSWKLTLLAMIVLPLVFLFIYYVGKKLRKYSERSQEKMADVNSVLEEAINNVRIVKAFSMEGFELKKFMRATGEFFGSLLRMARIRRLASPINDTLISIAGVTILLYAGARIISGTGELDAGDFMTFVIAMFSLIKPVKSLSQVHVKLQEGVAAAKRVFKVLDTDEKIVDKPGARDFDQLKTGITYDNITFSYNENESVLHDISFEVPSGKVVAIVGPSGAGKSTLLDLLPRFYDPQQGRITVDDVDICDLKLSSLRSLMGIVTQETLLFNDSVFNNIAYGRSGVERERVYEAARMANADQFIRELENGYDTMVGNRGVMLSGGQRQRLAIARALVADPQILIFDEATSALDTESELLVQEAISRLMSGRTTLVVAHRLSTIVHADRIVVIDKGRMVEQGNHEELLKAGGLYHKLYQMQFKNGAEEVPRPTPGSVS